MIKQCFGYVQRDYLPDKSIYKWGYRGDRELHPAKYVDVVYGGTGSLTAHAP